MSGRPVPLERAAFRRFRPITTRWADNDVFGHVNNVVYYAWFDTAVTGWLVENGLLDGVSSKVICVVAATRCDYFGSIAFPDPVSVGIAVERLGARSVTYRIGVFRGDERRASAQGTFTHVYVERGSRTPAAIPADVRMALEALMA